MVLLELKCCQQGKARFEDRPGGSVLRNAIEFGTQAKIGDHAQPRNVPLGLFDE